MPETARITIMSAATARPARGVLAALLILSGELVGAVAVRAAERLLGLPSGTVALAAVEDARHA